MYDLNMVKIEVVKSVELSPFQGKTRFECHVTIMWLSRDIHMTLTQILVTSNDSRLRLYNLKDHSLSCKYKGCLNTSSQIRATFRYETSSLNVIQYAHWPHFCCCYSRDGLNIICGSEDNFIYVWKTHHDVNKLSSVRRDRNEFYESFTSEYIFVYTAWKLLFF